MAAGGVGKGVVAGVGEGVGRGVKAAELARLARVAAAARHLAHLRREIKGRARRGRDETREEGGEGVGDDINGFGGVPEAWPLHPAGSAQRDSGGATAAAAAPPRGNELQVEPDSGPRISKIGIPDAASFTSSIRWDRPF